nr:13410_t:CDS:2 [Entrophospora candida]
MEKITKTQFENWSKNFRKKLEAYLYSNESNLTPGEYVQSFSLISAITNGVKDQIPFAVMIFITFYEGLPGHDLIKNNVYSDTDGLTLQQWLENIKKKLKEHAEANGYYKPTEPVDKPSLRQKDSDLIIKTKVFLEQIKEISKTNDELSDIKENSGMLNEYPFLIKDLIGPVEEAQKKAAEAEKNQKNKGNINNNPQDNSKLKWVIGLGLVAFIFSAVILFLTKRKEVKKLVREKFKHSSPMQTTDIEKIILNSGVGQAIGDKKFLENTEKALIRVAQGQKPILTHARNSITNFKLREGMPIGCKVTLRKKRAWDFLFELINIDLPNVSNLQGFSSRKFDRDGNYNFGIDTLSIFPTVPYDLTFKNQGVQITIVFKSHLAEENAHFLSLLGFPFKKK